MLDSITLSWKAILLEMKLPHKCLMTIYAPINVKPPGGRLGKGGGFDSSHRPVVGFFYRFNGLSSNILLTFSCYFDNLQCPGVRHLNGNSPLSSNAPPMPGLPAAPPQQLNIDRCIILLRQSLRLTIIL